MKAKIPSVIAKMEDVTFEKVEGPRFSIVALIHSWIEDFSQDEIDAFILSYRAFYATKRPPLNRFSREDL